MSDHNNTVDFSTVEQKQDDTVCLGQTHQAEGTIERVILDSDTPELKVIKTLAIQLLAEKAKLKTECAEKENLLSLANINNHTITHKLIDLEAKCDYLASQLDNIQTHSMGSSQNPAKRKAVNPFETQMGVQHSTTTSIDQHPPSLPCYGMLQQSGVTPKRLRDVEKSEEKVLTAYEIGDRQRVEMKLPHQEHLNQKEKLILYKETLLNQQKTMLTILEKFQMFEGGQMPHTQTVEIEEFLKSAKHVITEQKKQVDILSKEVNQSKEVATHFSPTLPKPILWEFVDHNIPGTQDLLKAKNV